MGMLRITQTHAGINSVMGYTHFPYSQQRCNQNCTSKMEHKLRLKVDNYFCKKLHLRCLTQFWICVFSVWSYSLIVIYTSSASLYTWTKFLMCKCGSKFPVIFCLFHDACTKRQFEDLISETSYISSSLMFKLNSLSLAF